MEGPKKSYITKKEDHLVLVMEEVVGPAVRKTTRGTDARVEGTVAGRGMSVCLVLVTEVQTPHD